MTSIELAPPPVVPPPPPALRRVLIVDDEPRLCAIWQECLVEMGGYDVEVAHSGFTAGITVARFRPELILLDIGLPFFHVAMDGLQLLKNLKGDPETSAIRVIACSGGGRHEDILAEVSRGTLYGYLEKPFSLVELVELVARALAPPEQAKGATPTASTTPGPAASTTPRASYASAGLSASALRV